MSKNELSFEAFLKSHNINYVIPEKGNFCITNVAFNKNGIYKPDFYLPDKNLYIEVKGFKFSFEISIVLFSPRQLSINS